VLVDLLFCQPGFHGGGEYGKAVFKALVAAAAGRGDVQVWAALDPALFIDGWVWQACREHAVNIVAVKSFAEIAGLVNAGPFSSFFAPAIVVYTGYEYQKRVGGPLAFTGGTTRVVGTLHDIRDQVLSEEWEQVLEARRASGCRAEQRCSPDQARQELARQAVVAGQLRTMYEGICRSPAIDRLVTVSEHSAASIRARVGCERRLEVLFAPAKDRPAAEPFAVPGVEAGRDEFALFVNAGRIEKNAAAAVTAFDRLCSDPGFAAEHPGLKFLLTGIGRVDDLGLASLAHPDRFVTLPHLPPERLEHLYREARFLLYPSFNEGFGYPPLEAMAHGTPSVVAANTAVPEVCGAAAIACDPFDLASITVAIRTILAAPPPAEKLSGQLATVAARQAADLARLIEFLIDPPSVSRDQAASSTRWAA
jgi:glycosyltransferase involved in cell wall biosynthesis